MQPEGRPCLKLFIRDVGEPAGSTEGFEFEGVSYDRVWLQGNIKQKLGCSFRLDDGTGEILVAASTLAGAQDLEAGSYALVVGKLVGPSGPSKPLHVKAHKVVNLSADAEAVNQRVVHWNMEVSEAYSKVYPLLTAALAQER